MIVPEHELRLTFEPSRGPGGQNVNKVSTCAVVTFNIGRSRALSDAQRQLLRRRLAPRITTSDEIRLRCDEHRTQAANRRAVLRRFAALMDDALRPPVPRKPTRPTAASRVRRRRAKRLRAEQKSGRRCVGPED